MARNEWEDMLQSVLQGGLQGYQAGRASKNQLLDAIRTKQLETMITPKKYEPTTMEEALEFERAKAGIIKPREEIKAKLDEERLRQLQGSEERLTPSERRLKRTDTSKLISGLQTIPVKKIMITEATESLKNLPKGQIGKWKMAYIKNFDPENPLNEDWQKVKMVLTDAQLMNTALTKGAISDKEMELFANAAGNDDILSIQKNKPVFNKLMRFLNAEEKSLEESYSINYGEKALQRVKLKVSPLLLPPQGNELEIKIQKARKVGYTEKQIQDYLRGKNAR